MYAFWELYMLYVEYHNGAYSVSKNHDWLHTPAVNEGSNYLTLPVLSF